MSDTTTFSASPSSSTSDLSQHYPPVFEGPEKLLEIWLNPTHNTGHSGPDLLSIPRHNWDDLCELAGCKILSSIKTEHVHSYLLSESSLFVFPYKIIMKTCGTTTILSALPKLLEYAQEYLGIDTLYRVFYTRKKYMFPERQLYPHQDWRDEVYELDNALQNTGMAYTLGRTNGDNWNLYFTEPLFPQPFTPKHEDQTTEIMMTELSPEKAKVWWVDEAFKGKIAPADMGHALGSKVAQRSGLADLFPEMNVDSYLFDPCGFSCNAILPGTGFYFTVHVTPEAGYSYASFETNMPFSLQGGDLSSLVKRICDIFGPGKLSVSCFDGVDYSHLASRDRNDVKNYTRLEQCVLELPDYNLTYRSYRSNELT